jgi:methylglutaconyl-CoA hydratase
MIEPYVKINIKNKIGYIEFYHPNRNSMPSEILLKLRDAIVDAGNNEAINIIVLKSGGDRTFLVLLMLLMLCVPVLNLL